MCLLRDWLNLKLQPRRRQKKEERKQKQSKELCSDEEALTTAVGATHGRVIAESCCDSVRQGAHRHLGESTQLGKEGIFCFSNATWFASLQVEDESARRRRTALIRARHTGADCRLADESRKKPQQNSKRGRGRRRGIELRRDESRWKEMASA